MEQGVEFDAHQQEFRDLAWQMSAAWTSRMVIKQISPTEFRVLWFKADPGCKDLHKYTLRIELCKCRPRTSKDGQPILEAYKTINKATYTAVIRPYRIRDLVNAHLAIGRSVPVVSNPDDFPFDTAPKTKED